MGIYKALTDYLPMIKNDSHGEWAVNRENKGITEATIQVPYVSYSKVVRRFQNDVYDFMENHPEYELGCYADILEANGIAWEKKSMQAADVSTLDGKCVMALIIGAIRADRFSEGTLLSFLENGTMTKWLLRLKEIDG